MESLLHDVRFAVRMLRKTPGASAVAVLSLALGIAVNATVFSWVRGVLLNPVPGVADAGRLATIETVTPSGEMIDSSYPDFQDYRDRTTLLDGVIAFKERPLGLGDDTRSERVWALMVSGNYFDVLGVRPQFGRFFAGSEQSDTPEAAPVAVLSDRLWRTHFNANPRIIGESIRLNNRQSFTVIGVAPPSFAGTITGLRFDLYVPLTMQASLTGGSQWLANRGSRPLYLFARLKDGVSLDQASGELTAVAAALADAYPRSNRGISATMLRLADARRGAQSGLATLLRILLGVGGLVLLIVCANLANLQLARASTRRREIGVRLGLGASRRRVVRQLLTESLVVAALAGAVSVLFTAWMVDFLFLLIPFIEYPIALAMPMGARGFAFVGVMSAAAAVLVGLVPALRASGADYADALRSGSRQAALDPGTNRVRGGLVVGEIALAMASLVAAGLLVRSFENARRVDPGFNAGGVALAGINMSTGGYDRDRGLRYLEQVRERIAALPGVSAQALAEDVPLGYNGGSWEDLDVEGYVPSRNENMKVYRNLVSPGYFDLMRIGRIEGRDFTDQDTSTTPPVAIVNQEFSRRYFAGASPIGRRFHVWGHDVTIVGMVTTTRYHALAEPPQPYFYVPLTQLFRGNTGVALHVRTTGQPLQMIATIRRQLEAIDPRMPAPVTTTLAEYIGAAYFEQRTAALLLGVMAAVALILACTGLYSLIAFGVAVRRQEIGVRMALGAGSGDILRLIVGEGARMATLGIGAGLVLAIVGGRALGSLLFGVSSGDVPTLLACAALLSLVATIASYLPARLAARTEPMAALRTE